VLVPVPDAGGRAALTGRYPGVARGFAAARRGGKIGHGEIFLVEGARRAGPRLACRLQCSPQGARSAALRPISGRREVVLPETQCPRCGSSEVVPRIVNDRLWAADPWGEPFEVALKLPVWRCHRCRLCWERDEAQAAKEAAYQTGLAARTSHPAGEPLHRFAIHGTPFTDHGGESHR
jgi:hypothetical protein